MMTETVVNVQEAPNNNATKQQHPQTTQQAQSPLAWIKINVQYFKTTPGLLKIAEIILGIICMSLASPGYYGTHFFLTVATASFIATLIWIFIYLLGVREALPMPINWILTELINTGICTLFYIVAFIVQLITAFTSGNHYYRGSYIAAGFFGLINTGVYAFATYLLHLEWKTNNNDTT